MKRTILSLGLAAFMVAAFGTRAQAQQGASSGGTRVAVVNIGLVFNKYEKAKFYKQEMEDLLKPYKLEADKLKKEIVDWSEAMKHKDFKITDRDRYEAGIVANKRKLEDLDRQARKLVGKKQEEQIVTLYKEVTGAIEAYAKSNGIQLVLGYGEQIEGDLHSFPNINRKMQGMDLGCTNPIFHAQGVDISLGIVQTLNYAYTGGKTVPATPTSQSK